MPPILHLTQIGVTQLARPIDTGTLILAEPGVVAGNLSAGSVEGSYDSFSFAFCSPFDRSTHLRNLPRGRRGRGPCTSCFGGSVACVSIARRFAIANSCVQSSTGGCEPCTQPGRSAGAPSPCSWRRSYYGRRQSTFLSKLCASIGKTLRNPSAGEQQLGAFACVGWRKELTPFWRLKMKMRGGLRFEKCFVVE